MSPEGTDLAESRGNMVMGIVISFTALALCVVSLRFYVRINIVKDVKTEDWAILAALVFATAEAVAVCVEVHYGLGRHIQTTSPNKLAGFLKSLWTVVLCYNISIASTKISLLLGYLRVFPHPRVKLASKITMGVVFIYSASSFIFTVASCKPVSFFWDQSTSGGYCITMLNMSLSHSALNMCTDIVIIVIPMPVLSSLNLARKDKIWLIIVFALGIFVIVVSSIRIPTLLLIGHSPDPTWDNVSAVIWSQVETCVAIICATLPTLKALVKKYFPSLTATGTNRTKDSSCETWTGSPGLQEWPQNDIKNVV